CRGGIRTGARRLPHDPAALRQHDPRLPGSCRHGDRRMSGNQELRNDLALIAGWIRAGARVLDLGCGDGALLAHLAKTKQVTGYGLEIDPDNVTACVARGVNVLQLDMDAGLAQFDDDSFDFVVMSSALQEARRPDLLVDEMLRIGRESIVTFPNFSHWRPRISLG